MFPRRRLPPATPFVPTEGIKAAENYPAASTAKPIRMREKIGPETVRFSSRTWFTSSIDSSVVKACRQTKDRRRCRLSEGQRPGCGRD